MRRGLWLAICLACKTTHSSESEVKGAVRVVESRDEGEWSVRTWEYAPRVEKAADGGAASGAYGAVHPQASTRLSPAAGGTLAKYTEELHSPSHSKSESSATGESETTVKSTFKPGGCLGLGLGGVLGLAALGGAVWLYRRYRP